MKVDGFINGQKIKILLDSGSTHNFMDSQVLKNFGWPSQPTKTFEVMIADGGKVSSLGCCRATELTLRG